MSLPVVVKSGTRLEGLRALRDHLAETLVVAEPAQTAALARQLADVLAQIETLEPRKEASAVDDLAAKRAARLAGPEPDGPADGKKQRRRRGGGAG